MFMDDFLIAGLCLFGFFSIHLFSAFLMRFGPFYAREALKHLPLRFCKRLWIERDWEETLFTLATSRHIYLIGTIFFLARLPLPYMLSVIACDIAVRWISAYGGASLFRVIAPFAFLALYLLSPLTLAVRLLKPKGQEKRPERAKLKEIIQTPELARHIDPSDQKLILSFVNFKERVAKEIMVPRVDLFALSADTPLQEAAELFSKEGYSRIPVYKETLDQIVGVVLYKDLLKYLTGSSADLSVPLETIAKPVLYAPENKKISSLLQEFRNRQIHMAIIVDEYGGTEGIVTIEDILEELVGEIEDEYDVDEETPFWEIPGSGWIIDAKMTLLDIAEKLSIHIPTHPEYETLGGYVYHSAGTIPKKGWRLSHDAFDLEVISSNERSINKVKLSVRSK